MICCKIIADYSNVNASFKKLCELLAKKGEFLWEDGVMYFADTEGDVTERQVKQCIKKAGYSKMFIDEYNIKDEPRETERIKGWIVDKLVKIHYQRIEKEHQDLFKNLKIQLDNLDKEILQMTEQQILDSQRDKEASEKREQDRAEDK